MKHQVLNRRCVLACIVSAGAGAGTALAEDTSEPNLTPAPCPANETCPTPQPAHPSPPPAQPQAYEAPTQEQAPPPFQKRYGLGISAGGGVADWFDGDLRDQTGTSGTWEVRGYVGLNQPIGLEVAYVGKASSLDPFLGPNISTDLVGNGVEAVARINVFHDLVVQPFGIIGIGWTHFSVNNNDVTLADFGSNNSDDVVDVPLGAGAAWLAPYGLLVDARFTFRPTLSDGMILTQVPVVNGVPLFPPGFVDMDSWEVSARVGYAF